jgi:hypothetical protein
MNKRTPIAIHRGVMMVVVEAPPWFRKEGTAPPPYPYRIGTVVKRVVAAVAAYKLAGPSSVSSGSAGCCSEWLSGEGSPEPLPAGWNRKWPADTTAW